MIIVDKKFRKRYRLDGLVEGWGTAYQDLVYTPNRKKPGKLLWPWVFFIRFAVDGFAWIVGRLQIALISMMQPDFFLGRPRDLTREELEALWHVKAGIRISEALYYRLELRDLIKKGFRGWQLTDAGEFRLAAEK